MVNGAGLASEVAVRKPKFTLVVGVKVEQKKF